MNFIFQHLKYSARSLIAIIAGCMLLAVLAACSEEQAPDVPREQTDLLFDILNDLENKKYEAALPKLKKYGAIDSTNILIERMSSQTITNMYVVKLRVLLEQGRFAEAEALMKSMLAQHDSLDDRVQLQNFTANLNKADQLIRNLAPVQDSETLRINAESLREHAKKLPGSEEIVKYAERKIHSAEELKKIEKDRKVVWTWFEALDAKKSGKTDRAELLRIFIAAQLDGFGDPMVRDLATED